MTPSKTLFYLCASFVAGVFWESIIYNGNSQYIELSWLYGRATYMALGFFVAGMLLIFGALLWRRKNLAVAGFCVLFLLLGVLRFQITEFTIEHNILKKMNDSPVKVTLTGFVSAEPDVRDTLQHLQVRAQTLIMGGKEYIASGDVLATLGIFTSYHYLDNLQITGKLETPKVFGDFNYENYLLKDGIYSLMYYPKAQVISTKPQYNPLTFTYEKILFFKEKMQASMDASFSGDPRALLGGIILGDNKNIAPDLQNKLNASGLRYLTAISGVHIIILGALLMAIFLALGMWRGQAFYLTITCIWFYIALTGFSASGLRAGIMASAFLLAQKLGRQNTAGRVLVLAAALMLLQNPLLLFYDVGFQLSFVAALGIIYLKPLLENIINAATKERARVVVEIIAITITAQLCILPIMAYNFGNVSLVAVATSLLVLPVMPWLMTLGFISSFLGIFSHFLGQIFGVSCWLLLLYFLKVVDIFSGPLSLAIIQNIPLIFIALYYAAIFILVKFLQKIQRPKFLGY